jgi:hypothetical protein
MNPARNEPCPCGSGTKYKFCCGGIAKIRSEGALRPRDASRSCGACAACCDGWLPGNVRGHEMTRGVPCHFRGEIGCGAYDERPADPCRNFDCAWVRSPNPFPESFRPDRLGVIILARTWRDRPAYTLVSGERDPDQPLRDWVRDYGVRTATPFLYCLSDGKLQAFGSPEFRQDMLDREARRERLL